MPPMGDGGFPANSAGAAAFRLEERAKRLQSLLPLHQATAKKWQAATDKAFATETSPAGEKWPPLAQSTLAQRVAAFQGARVGRGAGGRFTRHRMLDKTGAMKRTTKYVPTATSIQLATVPYMAPHVTGDRKRTPPQPPKRNPLVLTSAGSKARIVDPFGSEYRADFIRFVETGEVP